jgi:hypothetical protein
LHLRVSPVGARMLSAGPELGQAVPTVLLIDADDSREQLRVSAGMDKDLLLLFVAPRCLESVR